MNLKFMCTSSPGKMQIKFEGKHDVCFVLGTDVDMKDDIMTCNVNGHALQKLRDFLNKSLD